MFSIKSHAQKNQSNYNSDAETHSLLDLDATLYLAYRDLPQLLEEHLFFKTPKEAYKILDFGCGAGLSTALIEKAVTRSGHKIDVFGVDINAENIKQAQKRLPHAVFSTITPGQKLDFCEEFDLVICNFVLVEVEQRDMAMILQTIQSVLSASGVAIITNCSKQAYLRSNKWYTFNNDFDENTPHIQMDGKEKFAEDQPIKAQVFTSGSRETSFTFYDFFHSGASYRQTYLAAGLTLLQTHKPVGRDSDGIAWEAEKERSPYKIHVLGKAASLEASLQASSSSMSSSC
ncbi:class I SAM-dependent methyltransferase [Legionella sp. CNM-4043-24]|uniref:class I SAM-dependent methyltransferase n=1 Tax=Legionella sp. CNM-4043-24 TaxID=3421646 RepID=UPI00403B069B